MRQLTLKSQEALAVIVAYNDVYGSVATNTELGTELGVTGGSFQWRIKALKRNGFVVARPKKMPQQYSGLKTQFEVQKTPDSQEFRDLVKLFTDRFKAETASNG